MHTENKTITTPNDFIPIIEQIIQKNLPKIILLKGDLGAGKTTFVKTFLNFLDPNIFVSSPTFTLMNVYQVDTIKINHFDLYRISNADEAVEWGFEEFVEDCDFSFIEWPERAIEIIPKPYTLIDIQHSQYENIRYLSVQIID